MNPVIRDCEIYRNSSVKMHASCHQFINSHVIIHFIGACMRKNNLFFGLQTMDLDNMIQCLKMRRFRTLETVYKLDDESNALYILLEGHCFLTSEKKAYPLLARGAIIGDLDLTQSHVRRHSLQIAEDDTILLKLMKQDYQSIIAAFIQRKSMSNYEILYESHLFRDVPIKDLKRIDEISEVKKYKKGKSGLFI
jgi:hypothetical protein